MKLFRIYACDSRLIERRLQLLIESTGCSTACGHYHLLSPNEVASSAPLDERLLDNTSRIRQLEVMASEGFSVYLLEVWCRYEPGYCPYPQVLRSCLAFQ